jgi:hypothetical protein
MPINNRTLCLASLHRRNHLPLHLQPLLLLNRAEACNHLPLQPLLLLNRAEACNHLPLQPLLLLNRAEACKQNLAPNVGDKVQINKSGQAGL